MSSDIYFTGGAVAVTQVSTCKVTAYDAATTYALAAGSASVTTIAAGSDTATAAALVTAWSASTDPRLLEVTPSSSGVSITFTGVTTGYPFTVTPSVSGGTGTIGSVTDTTACAGPNFFNTAANYSGSATPGNGDTVTITGGVPIKYGLSNTSLTTLTLRVHDVTRDFQLGLPTVNNSSGFGSYPEYRTQALTIKGATLITIDADQCGLIRLDTGSASVAVVNVYNTGTRLDSTIPALTIVGANASNEYNLLAGDIGLGIRPGETVTAGTVRIGVDSNSQVSVAVGYGSTLTSVTVAGGTFDSYSGVTTLVADGGTAIIRGAGAVTTATARNAGLLRHQSTGTITTLNAGPGGSVDFTHDDRARTVTNSNFYTDCTVDDRLGTVTWTNASQMQQCDVDKFTLRGGANRTVKVS